MTDPSGQRLGLGGSCLSPAVRMWLFWHTLCHRRLSKEAEIGMELWWGFKRRFSSVVDLEEDSIDGKKDDKEQALLGEKRRQGEGLQAREAGWHLGEQNEDLEQLQ